jgi:hypothetical protein
VSADVAPAERLPAAAKAYWRTCAAAAAVLAALLALPALGPLWAGAIAAVLVAAGWVGAAVLWARWRYEIRPGEIDLRHGLWTVRRTLVPIRRIQHVDTASGPIQSAFDLATVRFHTAAGKTEIPALTRARAEGIRRHVAELARTRDDT